MGDTNFSAADRILVDGRPISTGALRLVGSIDCSGNPNYPESKAGDVRKVSVAGKIGGGSGKNVSIGDVITCLADSAAGTQAAVGANFMIEEANVELTAGQVIAKGTPAASIADAAQTSAAPAPITAAAGEPTAAALADTQALEATVAAAVTDIGVLTAKLNLALAALDAFGITL